MSPKSEKKTDAPDVIELPASAIGFPAPSEETFREAGAHRTPLAKPRVTPPTRFPRLPALGERELAAMAPHRRAAFTAEKAHQDAWGHLPPQVSQHLRSVELPPQAVEHHAREAKTDPVHFAAARAYYRWALGQEMSREQYDAAVAHVLSEPHGR